MACGIFQMSETNQDNVIDLMNRVTALEAHDQLIRERLPALVDAFDALALNMVALVEIMEGTVTQLKSRPRGRKRAPIRNR